MYNFGCGQTFLTKIKSEILCNRFSQNIPQSTFVLEDELDIRKKNTGDGIESLHVSVQHFKRAHQKLEGNRAST